VKVTIPKKGHEGKQETDRIDDEFTGKNIARFSGNGLIRRFFKGHRVKKSLESDLSGPKGPAAFRPIHGFTTAISFKPSRQSQWL
jgi:hypothetical protein